MEGFIAEIRYFGGNFAPRNWAFCNGQILSIAQNTALFSLLGTTYGGNGQTTFALPDFRGRVAVGTGQGPGLSSYSLGEQTGAQSFTILANNLPAHTHPFTGSVTMNGNAAEGNSDAPQNDYPASQAGTPLYATASNGSFMGAMQHNLGTTPTGSQTPVSNLMPVLGLNYVICLFGIFPSRN
jgi:microcystin-dependent protein